MMMRMMMRKMILYDTYDGCNDNHGDGDDDVDDGGGGGDAAAAAAADGYVGIDNGGVSGNYNGDDYICWWWCSWIWFYLTS